MNTLTSSFANKLRSSQGHFIRTYTANDNTGRLAYYLIHMDTRQKASFDAALRSGRNIINFKDYGRIIASCYGDSPTEQMKRMVKDTYGVEL